MKAVTGDDSGNTLLLSSTPKAGVTHSTPLPLRCASGDGGDSDFRIPAFYCHRHAEWIKIGGSALRVTKLVTVVTVNLGCPAKSPYGRRSP